jgi:hypothetical protein
MPRKCGWLLKHSVRRGARQKDWVDSGASLSLRKMINVFVNAGHLGAIWTIGERLRRMQSRWLKHINWRIPIAESDSSWLRVAEKIIAGESKRPPEKNVKRDCIILTWNGAILIYRECYNSFHRSTRTRREESWIGLSAIFKLMSFRFGASSYLAWTRTLISLFLNPIPSQDAW